MRHLPNLICLMRIALIWPIAVALDRRADYYRSRSLLFIVAAVSDGLDGYLAKRFNWTSELGRFLDPLADKLLLIIVFVEAAWLAHRAVVADGGVVARDVMIGLGALVLRVWIGPLHGRPSVMSKVNTAAQLGYVMLVLLTHAAARAAGGSSAGARVADVLASTLLSGWHYLATFTRRAWGAARATAA